MIIAAALLAALQGAAKTADEWAAVARERHRDAAYADSIDAWTKAIALAKDRPEFFAGRGLAWERRENLSNARGDYDSALAIDPANTAALYYRGLLQRRQNRHKEADADLARAAETVSDLPAVILIRAYAKMALGRFLPPSQRVDAPDEPDNVALTGAVIEWVRGALDDLNLVLKKDPSNGGVLAERASVYISLGKFKEAEADLQASIALAPKLATTHFELGRLMEYTGRQKESLDEFTKAVELDPKYAGAWFGRGNARGKLGDKKGAIADFSKALALYGKWTSVYFNRALARAALKDMGGALSDFNKVIELDSGTLTMAALCNRAWCKTQLKDAAGAKKDYAKAATMPAERAWDLQYRSIAKEGLGDLKGAIADMEQALEKSAAGSAERRSIEEALTRLRNRK